MNNSPLDIFFVIVPLHFKHFFIRAAQSRSKRFSTNSGLIRGIKYSGRFKKQNSLQQLELTTGKEERMLRNYPRTSSSTKHFALSEGFVLTLGQGRGR